MLALDLAVYNVLKQTVVKIMMIITVFNFVKLYIFACIIVILTLIMSVIKII